MRKFLSHDATCTILHAFITSQIDYSNSLMNRLPNNHIKKLQRVQNTAAGLVSNLRKCNRITPVLFTLQWLPVKYRIGFKNIVDHLQQTSWQNTWLHPRNDHPIKEQIFHDIQWSLCSEDSKIQARHFRKRVFAVCGPLVWISCQRKLAYARKLKHSSEPYRLFSLILKMSLLLQFDLENHCKAS